MPYSPTYSHQAATGTGNGNPIWIVSASNFTCFEIIATGAQGATATVFIECNSGAVSDTGVPAAAEWIDQTFGGISVVIPASGVQSFDKKILISGKPAWRTRISANAGCTITSYIPFLITPGGDWVHAGRPPSATPNNFGY